MPMDIKGYDIDDPLDCQRFFEDCLKICGIYHHPAGTDLFQRAWQYGYRGGPVEVLICLWDLVDMEGL